MRLTPETAVVEPIPSGLSRMIQPWSISQAQAEDPQEEAQDGICNRRDEAADDIDAELREDEKEHHHYEQRIAADPRERGSGRSRKQALYGVPAVEGRNRQQVEDAEEDVDQDEVERVGSDETSRAAVGAAGEIDGRREDRRAEQSQQQVHPGPGKRDQHHVAARVPEAAVVDGNRLGPAEDRAGVTHRED